MHRFSLSLVPSFFAQSPIVDETAQAMLNPLLGRLDRVQIC